MSFESEQGHPAWYPFAFLALVLIGAGSFGAVFYTMNVRWFLITVAVVLVMGAFAKR
jgi:hypothetical protein